MDQLINNINLLSEKYRPIPFWSWNDKLNNNELVMQIEEMRKAGIGGFFMHARGGLATEYLSNEWFEAVKVCIEEGKKNGMQAWCYDENGWPSGSANGVVPSCGFELQEKSLIFASTPNDNNSDKCLGYYIVNKSGEVNRYENSREGAIAVYISVNKYYIDSLNPESIQRFIEETHEKYHERLKKDFGTGITGFFTDEPQFSKGAIPWTDELPLLFKNRYHYDINDNLIALVCKTRGFEKIRNDYWTLVSELFTNSFIKQIFQWCESNSCMLTGHLMSEDSLFSQMCSTAGVMPSYEYFHIPGIDWLGRCISSPVVPKQVSSVCEQLGRKMVITETFALCGWDVGFEELKWIAQWQYVNGINMMCQHLEGYTIRGCRKRDYPPSLFIQQPWWNQYLKFNEYFARLGALLSMGEPGIEVLLLHPLKSAYIAYDLSYNEELERLDTSFTNTTTRLNELHIEHHYADETILKKHGNVEKGKIKIGSCAYSVLLMPQLLNISSETFCLIKTFVNNGGLVMRTGDLPHFVDGVESTEMNDLFNSVVFIDLNDEKVKSDILAQCTDIKEKGIECREIQYRSRLLGEGSKVHYFVNNDKEKSHECIINIPNSNSQYSILDLENMGMSSVSSKSGDGNGIIALAFMPMQSFVLIENKSPQNIIREKEYREIISLDKEFFIDEISHNSLTLDYCTYKIDDGEWQPRKAVILLQQELLNNQKSCMVDMKFNFSIGELSKNAELYLILESPELFEIKVNEKTTEYADCGYFVDKSFKKIDIRPFASPGVNTIELKCRFFQKPDVYDALFGKNVHESVKNKITYDSELESIYIIGDFCLKNKSPREYGDKKSIWTAGDFELCDKPGNFLKGDLTSQGLWFFSGQIKLSQRHSVDLTMGKRYFVKFDALYAPVSTLYVNSKPVKTIMWAPYEVDVTDYLVNGENDIGILLYSSNRNLLGPHHFSGGESYFVGPSTFTDKKGWADDCKNEMWTDDYCFVKFGVE